MLVTLDRNLSYQQRMANRTFVVLTIRVTDQTPESFRVLVPKLRRALEQVAQGEVREISAEVDE